MNVLCVTNDSLKLKTNQYGYLDNRILAVESQRHPSTFLETTW